MSSCSRSSSHLFPPSIFTTFFPSHLFLTIAEIGNEERKIRYCGCERDRVPEWERKKSREKKNEMKGKNLLIYHSQIHCWCYSFLSFSSRHTPDLFYSPNHHLLAGGWGETFIFFFSSPQEGNEIRFTYWLTEY